MNTEITDTINSERQNWVCYDADCARCVRWAGWFRGLCERHGFTLIPLQSPDARARLRTLGSELLAEMRVITRDGIVFGGGDALVYLSRVICRPLFALTRIPGVKPLLRVAYRFVARRHGCGPRACENPPRKRTVGTPVPLLLRVGNPTDGLPLLVFPPTAAVIGKEFTSSPRPKRRRHGPTTFFEMP